MKLTTLAVIPARFASTRLPGKLLQSINNKPLLWWTWDSARRIKNVDRLVIAAADSQIAKAARDFGAEVIEVFDDLPSGSDRVCAVVRYLENVGEGYSLVVNIQGDEPMLDPISVEQLIRRFTEEPSLGVCTIAAPLKDIDEYQSTSVVKLVMDENDCALYFSRSPIPYGWSPKGSISAWKHLGIYAYRTELLKRFVEHREGLLEKVERLEQLRFLEMRCPIGIVRAVECGISVDTAEELEMVRKLMDPNSNIG